jgi:hypothetical protein
LGRILAAALGLLALAGCMSIPRVGPGRTVVEPRNTVLPARIVSNFFTVESKWSDGHTYRFLIDTGSTVSYVSPDLARRFALKPKRGTPPARVRVRSASGEETELDSVTLRRVTLGDTSFEAVTALVFDFTDLSSHLGLTIDGIIGFPVFRETVLTLDYPGQRLIIAPSPDLPAPVRADPHASTIALSSQQSTPLIPVQLGNESFIVQVDSGSDLSLSLNPAGLHPRFTSGPRAGTVISSLQGDRNTLTGRLGQTLLLGNHIIENPVVDLTDQLSSLGGELLRNFTVTFDQQRNQVTFTRQAAGPVTMAPRRSAGLSFVRSPVYWRVLTVIPDTPVTQLPVQPGDLCVRINGETVDKWPFDRYEALVQSAAKITYTFLRGAKETDVEVPVIDLVP